MMSMKFEKWWWPVQCYTLSNGLNFAGLVRLGYLYSVSVWCLWKYFGEWEILQQQSQQFLITSFIREIMEAVYFIFCCFRRLSYELLDFSFFSFLFFSFRAILNCLNRGRLIKNWKRKKEIICSGTYLSRCSFFLIAAFFCLVAFWLFTIGQLKILGNLSKRTTSWDLLWIKI